jgi:hypothetical protein
VLGSPAHWPAFSCPRLAGSQVPTEATVIVGGTDLNKEWVIIALGVAGLYWLQAVLIPLVLAILLDIMTSAGRG